MIFTGRDRVLLVVAIAWVIAIYTIVGPHEEEAPRGAWKDFLLLGVGPVALVVAVTWIRAGFAGDIVRRGVMDKATRALIAKRLEIEAHISVVDYQYKSLKMEHLFTIYRKGEVGQLVMGRDLVVTYTAAGIVQRLASPEVERQFENFHNKRLFLGASGIRVELGFDKE